MGYFEQESAMDEYLSYFKRQSRFRDIRHRFLFAKGNSSSVPILKRAINEDCLGGGFYVQYESVGLVIDPGIDFVDSLHKFGRCITDIKYIIVTHDHLDHNADLTKLITLNYEYNKYIKGLSDVCIYNGLEEHTITLYCDSSTFKKFNEEYLKEANIKAINIKNLKKASKAVHSHCIDNESNGINASFFPVKHGKCETYALKLQVEGYKSISYSSDTGYFPELGKFLQADIVILNISEAESYEFTGIFKGDHLGFNGCCQLIKELNNDCAICISEFCCLKGQNIWDTICKIREVTGNNLVIPSVIGLEIDISNKSLYCMLCGEAYDLSHMRLFNMPTDISSLMIACDKCGR